MHRILAAAAASLAAACASIAAPSHDLDALASDYQAFLLANDPIQAGLEGDAEAAGRLPSVTPETLAAERAGYAGLLARAEAISSDALDDQERATRGLLIHEINVALLGYDYDTARAPFVNDSGFFTTLDYLARSTPLRTVADADALLARYRDYPRYAAENIANMRRGLETGWIQPALVVDRVIAILEAQQVGNPLEHALYEPFKTLPDSWSEEDRTRIRNEAQMALAADLGSAFAETLAFFKDEYRPRARESLGALELPEGPAWYAARVKQYTTLDVTPEEVHLIGLDEVARIRAEMDAIIDEVGFDGAFAEFLEFLRTDDQFYADTPEELLMAAAWIAKRTDGQMPAFFATLPRLSYGVIKVPDAIAPAYTTGRYFGGDYDNGVAGNFVVNTYALRERPLYELPALALHEGVPGHHHQISLASEIEGLPEFRRNVYVTAFGEGWGLYAESLGEEMGIYRTPYERFGKLSYEMWRACRLVADTGLHAMGWSRAEAEACFLENSALSRGNITTEVDRYIAWPGQALAYKIGQMKITELRGRAEAALGEDFDVRRFHDAVLLQGAVTMEMLDDQIDRWIAAELAGDE